MTVKHNETKAATMKTSNCKQAWKASLADVTPMQIYSSIM